MNQYEIAIIALLALEAITLIVLWQTHVDRTWWRNAWVQDTTELLSLKRNASLRDSKTGRFIKKDTI
jgi:hypothetical protein